MTHAQFQSAVIELLLDIRQLLSVGLETTAADVESGCAHPDEARVDLSTFTQPNHWICRRCKYEHSGLTQN